jgi:hypothetical protein
MSNVIALNQPLFDEKEVMRSTITLRIAYDAQIHALTHGDAKAANAAFETFQEATRQWRRATGIGR